MTEMHSMVGQVLDTDGGHRAKQTNCSMDDTPTNLSQSYQMNEFITGYNVHTYKFANSYTHFCA